MTIFLAIIGFFAAGGILLILSILSVETILATWDKNDLN